MLPQAMAYGIVSGLGPVAGLYGTMTVCLFAGVFGGTRGMIGGPNMFVAEAFTTAMLAGLIQLAFGALKLGRYVAYIPYSLMSGFFTAAGLLIIVTQVVPALGGEAAGGGIVGNIRAWPAVSSNVNLHAVAVAAVSLGVAVFWPRRLARWVPAQFLALVLAALAGMLIFRDAPVIGSIPFEFPGPQLPVLIPGALVRLLEPAFIIALLSSVSTLVVAMQIDTITGTRHHPNREIASQGLGNFAAGVVGGMPGGMSGATFANVASGGRTQLAGVAATLTLLVLVIGVRPVTEDIPIAAFSGILMVIGWNFMDRAFLSRIRTVPRAYVGVAALTVALALLVSFVDAMLIGMVVATFVGARRSEGVELSRLVSVPLPDRVVLEGAADSYEARTALVVFPDRVSVASARELARIVGQDVTGQRVIIFDLSRTEYVDDTAATMMGQMVNTALGQSTKRFLICGLKGDAAATLSDMGALGRVPESSIVADLSVAKRQARLMLLEEP